MFLGAFWLSTVRYLGVKLPTGDWKVSLPTFSFFLRKLHFVFIFSCFFSHCKKKLSVYIMPVGCGNLGKCPKVLSVARSPVLHIWPGLISRWGRHRVRGGSSYFRAGGSAHWGSKNPKVLGLQQLQAALWSLVRNFYPAHRSSSPPQDRNLGNYLLFWWFTYR